MSILQQQQFLQKHALQQFQFIQNFPTAAPQFSQSSNPGGDFVLPRLKNAFN